jgi:hypothetical protein
MRQFICHVPDPVHLAMLFARAWSISISAGHEDEVEAMTSVS